MEQTDGKPSNHVRADAMNETPVLQKLLMPWLSQAVSTAGYFSLGGPVVTAGDAACLRTSSEVVSAYGLGATDGPFGGPAPEAVHVVRFAADPLMVLSTPAPDNASGVAGYENGFLPSSSILPVYDLRRTRFPVGAEFWRIDSSGEQELLSAYGGAARGWRGAQGFLPPVHLTGPQARFQGVDYVADFLPDQHVELVFVGERGPEGFEETRPRIWARRVPIAACESIFDIDLTGSFRDVPVRVIQPGPAQVLLLVYARTEDEVMRTGAREVEPGVYEAVAPTSDVSNRYATRRVMVAAGAGTPGG